MNGRAVLEAVSAVCFGAQPVVYREWPETKLLTMFHFYWVQRVSLVRGRGGGG